MERKSRIESIGEIPKMKTGTRKSSAGNERRKRQIALKWLLHTIASYLPCATCGGQLEEDIFDHFFKAWIICGPCAEDMGFKDVPGHKSLKPK